MKKKLIIPILAVAVLAFFGMSCEDTGEITQEEIIAALEDMIAEDEALNIEEFGDGGADDEEYGDITDGSFGRMTDDYFPSDSLRFRFGRRVDSLVMIISHEFIGDTIVISTIEHIVGGQFITVIYDTSTGAQVDSFAKDFTTDAIRKVKFVRINNTDNPRWNWRLDSLTPVVSLGEDKISIDSLKIYSANGSLLYLFESDGIQDLFIKRDEIPTFQAWLPIVMKLYISNAGPVYNWESGEGAHLKFGRGRRDLNRHLHIRLRFYDDGTNGDDAVANDDEFSCHWWMHPPGFGYNLRVFKAFVDVIDFETLFSSDGSYHAAFWGFPYHSVRGE